MEFYGVNSREKSLRLRGLKNGDPAYLFFTHTVKAAHMIHNNASEMEDNWLRYCNINFTICTNLPITMIFLLEMPLLHEQHRTQPIEVMITQHLAHVIHRWCLPFSVYLA